MRADVVNGIRSHQRRHRLQHRMVGLDHYGTRDRGHIVDLVAVEEHRRLWHTGMHT